MTTRWRKHFRQLVTLRDQPQSIALGAALGLFLGFTPLFGVKTILALALASLLRVNRVAAFVGVTLHDLTMPFWPVVYRVKYDLGFWLLHQPHQWPPHLDLGQLNYHAWLHWERFAAIGVPTLLGSVILGAPTALLGCSLLKLFLDRRQRRQTTVAIQSPRG